MIGSGNLTGSIRFYSSQTTNKGSAVAETVYTVLWCALVNRLLRNYLGMLAVVPVYVVANVLICPVIFDIVTYVPAMQYIWILFPVGIYLY